MNFVKVTREDQVRLGDKVRDYVTGYTGIATSRIVYLNGCVRYGVQAAVDKDGKMQPGEFVDWQQLEQEAASESTPVRAIAGGGAQSMTPDVR